ncbi:low affinity potassium transporter, partial [Rhizophlyctis rosea]
MSQSPRSVGSFDGSTASPFSAGGGNGVKGVNGVNGAEGAYHLKTLSPGRDHGSLSRRSNASGRSKQTDDLPPPIPLQKIDTTKTSIDRTGTLSLLEPDRHVLEHLGGVEYRALESLQWIILLYFFGIQCLGAIIFRLYLFANPSESSVVSSVLSPWWFSAWMAVSGFNQVGITLLDAGPAPFGNAVGFLTVLCFLILCGNTAFPIFLRWWIWGLERWYLWRGDVNRGRVYHYLLKYPRRCFTHLFDRRQTYLLLGALIILNLLQFGCSLGLDFSDPAFEGVSRFAHFFQSIATRNGGFQIVSFANLHPAMLWIYIIMMYLSSTYPVNIAIRSTAQTSYNSRDLTTERTSPKSKKHGENSSITQVRRLMLNDIVSIFALIFLILVFESGR